MGSSLSGKSTLAKFLEEHISPEGKKKDTEPMIKLLSTDSLHEIMRKHIAQRRGEELLHASFCRCGNILKCLGIQEK